MADQLKLEQTRQEGVALEMDLASKNGAILLKNIESLLTKRIVELMDKDEYCQGILALVKSIDYKMNAARKAASTLASTLKPKGE